ncbi:MAG: hypothetical protein SNI51_07815 [Rikenellaceae bacterium]
MSAGLIIGLIFIALCIIVQVSGVLEDSDDRADVAIPEHKSLKNTSSEQSDESMQLNQEPKKIVYYRTEKEFMRLLDRVDESVELEEALSVDEDIASYIYNMVKLDSITTFYEYEKTIETINIVKERLLRVVNLDKRVPYGIKLVLKMSKEDCLMEGYNEESCLSIYNNMHNELDTHTYITNTIVMFEKYWNGVLNGYVRHHAYVNRLEYLVDYIEDLLKKEYIKHDQPAREKLISLQSSYATKLQMDNTQVSPAHIAKASHTQKAPSKEQ